MTGEAPRAVAIPPWVPAEMLALLDLSELAAEDPRLLQECALLSASLGANVAAYRRSAAGRPGGLCSYYRTTDLTAPQVGELIRAESRFPDAIFVAYRNPLERHDGGGLTRT